jgi:N-acetylmuramic acid 6-phosphate etherase
VLSTRSVSGGTARAPPQGLRAQEISLPRSYRPVKLVLNMLSTISMIRLGKTFGNLMVDVSTTNDKLHARVRRIVGAATGASPERVEEALSAADGDAKVAIVALLAGVEAAEARARLAAAGYNIRVALHGPRGT